MTVRLLYLTIVLLVFTSHITASTDGATLSANSAGMGGVSVAVNRDFFILNNQAVSAYSESLFVTTNYAFDFTGIGESTVLLALPTTLGTFSTMYSHYGDDRYGESLAGLAYARCFGDMLAVSLQFDYYSLSIIGNHTNAHAFGGELGLIATPVEDFTVGFHIFNFSHAHFNTLYYQQDIPTSVRLGFSYTFTDEFMVACEGENNSFSGTSFKGGFDYKIMKAFALRAGAGSNPAHASIGLGVMINQFTIDLAGESIQNFGERSTFSLSYSF